MLNKKFKKKKIIKIKIKQSILLFNVDWKG